MIKGLGAKSKPPPNHGNFAYENDLHVAIVPYVLAMCRPKLYSSIGL